MYQIFLIYRCLTSLELELLVICPILILKSNYFTKNFLLQVSWKRCTDLSTIPSCLRLGSLLLRWQTSVQGWYTL